MYIIKKSENQGISSTYPFLSKPLLLSSKNTLEEGIENWKI